jgi:hypothetical protein
VVEEAVVLVERDHQGRLGPHLGVARGASSTPAVYQAP